MKTIDLHDFNLALIMSTPKIWYWYTIILHFMGAVLFILWHASPQWSPSLKIDQQCRKIWSLNFVVVYFYKTLKLFMKCCLHLFQIPTILEQLHNISHNLAHHVWWPPISFLETLQATLHMLWNYYCCSDPFQNVALFYPFLIIESCEMCKKDQHNWHSLSMQKIFLFFLFDVV